MTKMRVTTEMEQEVLQYLNDLRDSGDCNMMGASPHVEAHFAMDRHEAREYVKMWMNNFQPSGEYLEIKSEEQ